MLLIKKIKWEHQYLLSKWLADKEMNCLPTNTVKWQILTAAKFHKNNPKWLICKCFFFKSTCCGLSVLVIMYYYINCQSISRDVPTNSENQNLMDDIKFTAVKSEWPKYVAHRYLLKKNMCIFVQWGCKKNVHLLITLTTAYYYLQ